MRERYGVIEVDVESQEVWKAGVRVPVAPRVAAVLVYLIRNPNRTVTKHELFDKVWEGRPVEDGAISRECDWGMRSGQNAIGTRKICGTRGNAIGECDRDTQDLRKTLKGSRTAPETAVRVSHVSLI